VARCSRWRLRHAHRSTGLDDVDGRSDSTWSFLHHIVRNEKLAILVVRDSDAEISDGVILDVLILHNVLFRRLSITHNHDGL